MSDSRILISGAGRIGAALAKIIAPQIHREIALWDTDSSKINHSFSAAELAITADIIFLCMPSSAVRTFIQSIKAEIAREVIIVSLVKGLDPKDGATMAELLTEILPPPPSLVALGGPMLSGELLQGHAAYGVAGCTAATFPRIQQLFADTMLRVSHSEDIQGVCVVGVLKNVYALGLGIAAALAVGDNTLGKLTVQAIEEMQKLTVILGGRAETVSGLAGVGDLIATGFSKHSRNRTVGQELVLTQKTAIASEGILSLPLLLRRLDPDISAWPFLSAIKAVVQENVPAQTAFKQLQEQDHS